MGEKGNEIREYTKQDSGNVDLRNRDPGSPVTK